MNSMKRKAYKTVYISIVALILLAFIGGCAKQAVQNQGQEGEGGQISPREEATAENQLFDEQELEDTSDNLDDLVSDLENLPI